MSDYVLLGPLLLQSFELPQTIKWGGAQRLVVHNLPGGIRVIDSLGRADDDITWSGVFSGTDAMVRARALDLLRAGGAIWPLTWSTFFYSVIIKSCEIDYTKSNWLPYRVTCTVVRDEAAVAIVTGLSIAEQISSDLSNADAVGSGVDFSEAFAATKLATATVSGTAANDLALTTFAGTVAALQSAINAHQPALAATTPTSAADLTVMSAAAGSLAKLTAARGYALRAEVNLRGSSGEFSIG